jgi:hypothetical protein
MERFDQRMSRPSSTLANASQAGQNSLDQNSSETTLFGVWTHGVRVVGRFLWFMFFLIILMAPFNMVAVNVNPDGKSLFDGKGFNPAAGLMWIAVVIYLPFAAHFSARWSRQLLGSKSGADKFE